MDYEGVYLAIQINSRPKKNHIIYAMEMWCIYIYIWMDHTIHIGVQLIASDSLRGWGI